MTKVRFIAEDLIFNRTFNHEGTLFEKGKEYEAEVSMLGTSNCMYTVHTDDGAELGFTPSDFSKFFEIVKEETQTK